MGVLFQAFYWNCPSEENQDGTWWNFVAGKIPELQQAGFTALWLPPASKAANLGGPSMGYDPYDYYDLGDFNQKSRTKTWFGNQAELVALINEAHTANMQVYADLVLDHNNGGDAQEPNPIDGQTRWTKFNPGSGKFPRNWEYFHPSLYETFDGMTFGDMPDLCHRNPKVYGEVISLAQWMIETIGFDGFRFDFVKGYAPWMVKAIAELRYLNKSEQGFYPFCVGECWDGERTIDDWLGTINSFMDNPVSAFDLPLHYRLRASAIPTASVFAPSPRRGPSSRTRRHRRSPSSTTTTPFAIPATPSTTTNCWPTVSSCLTKAIPAFSGWTGTTSGWRRRVHRTESPRWWPLMSNMPAARRKCSMPMTTST